ncbi:MAG: HDIG domain-containing protein [Candidatus Omnitrophica bacterium]|nr:HDIG domain-containing protein [Candidatus Omnitrophota bacterium]
MKHKSLILNIALYSLAIIATFFVAWISGFNLIVPIIIFSLFSFLSFYLKKGKEDIYLKLGLLLIIIIVSAKFIVNYSSLSYYFIPAIAVSMLTVILFEDLVLGFAVTAVSSILTGVVANFNLTITLIFFIGGIVGILSIWRARRRSQIILAGVYVGVVQLFCFLLIFLRFFSLDHFLKNYAVPVLSGGIVASFIVIGSLPIFEYLFKVTTNISLLELSDFNHPLLRKMILEAPGTYQHSLLVGNLAEAASEAVGANSLLARVGAYYHDIGKIEKAEYFSENQIHFQSKHDKLQPTMSRLIITNHIKEGVELGRKYRLNPMIIDFITQHHGTSVIYYFYRKAIQGIEESNQSQEEVFRYPGPKPQKKETAIVLLADAAEAASRTLSEPTAERLEEIVKKVINNKFIDGQLDECDLTLKDLEVIGNVFLRILSAIYHPRVRYPEEKHETKNNKPSKQNPHTEKEDSKQDKKDSQATE